MDKYSVPIELLFLLPPKNILSESNGKLQNLCSNIFIVWLLIYIYFCNDLMRNHVTNYINLKSVVLRILNAKHGAVDWYFKLDNDQKLDNY